MNYSLHRLDSKYTSNCISIAYNFRLQCSEWYALTCLVHVNKFMPKSVNSVRRKNVGRNIILNRNYQKFVMVYAACIQTLGVEATIYWNRHRSFWNNPMIIFLYRCNSNNRYVTVVLFIQRSVIFRYMCIVSFTLTHVIKCSIHFNSTHINWQLKNQQQKQAE